MARGWESKAVEEQVEESNNTPHSVPPVETTASTIEDPERKHKLDSLRLVRSQVSEQLRNARTVSQRQMLHQRLKAIDTDMEALG